MKRYLAGWIVMSFILILGCGSSNEGGYTVLFRKPVMIFDKTVYNNGMPIGNVEEVNIDPAIKSKVRINLEPKFRSLLAENHVFYINSGQLCLATISPFGEPLETNATISGFSSKADLTFFRLIHLFSDKVAAARTRVEQSVYR